jgi:hypothetical protein
MRVSQLTILMTAALCLFCSDSSAPGPSFAGDYTLRTVNGQALPVNFPAGEVDTIRWVSGSVQALPSRRFSRDLVQEFWEGETLAHSDTVHFSDAKSFYRTHGTMIQFYDVIGSLDGLSVDTVPAFSGTLNSNGSALTIITNDGLAGANTQFQYER